MYELSDFGRVPVDDGTTSSAFSGGGAESGQLPRTRSKCYYIFLLRYLIVLIILGILQFTIHPSIPYIVSTFFASAHGGGDCAEHPKSKPCRMGAADATLYHGYSDAASNVVAMLVALPNGSYSDAIGRRPLIRFAACMWLLPLIALAFHLFNGLSLWVYLILVPTLHAFDLNGVYMAMMSDLIPEREERAAAFGLFLAIFLFVSAIDMPVAFLIPQEFALWVSIVGACLRVIYLFTVFPETAAKSASDADRVGVSGTMCLAFRVLTRHSFIFRMTCILTIAGLGGSGYAIVFPPFMTGYLGFERNHKLLLFLAMGGSMVTTFMVILSPLTRRFGEVRVLQIGFALSIFFPICCTACTEIWHLILLVGIFAGPLTMSYPVVMAIKSNLVAQDEQGLVQGAIASIGKGTATIGFIFFSLLFKRSTQGGEIKSHTALYVPFLVIASINLLGCMLACTLPLTPPPPPDKADDLPLK